MKLDLLHIVNWQMFTCNMFGRTVFFKCFPPSEWGTFMGKTEKIQMTLIHSTSRSEFHPQLSSMMVFQYRQIQSFHLHVILCHGSSVLCAALWSSVTCFKCAILTNLDWKRTFQCICKKHNACDNLHQFQAFLPFFQWALSLILRVLNSTGDIMV